MNWAQVFPLADSLRGYHRSWLRSDVSAGLTVAVLMVPQAMAYAMLAGLPPVTGLYASMVPLLVYAIFGSSRQLSVGPAAVLSLLVFVGCAGLATPGSPEFLDCVILLTLMTGVMQVLLGALRMGFLVNFVSHAVISGFTSAAAVIIVLSQTGSILGVPKGADSSVIGMVLNIWARLGEVHGLTPAMGVAAMIVLLAGKKAFSKFPVPLFVVGVFTLMAFYFRLDLAGLAVVGRVPQGLPQLTLPQITWQKLGMLMPTAISIVITGFMMSIAISESIASREKYKVNANREFLGLGLANAVGAFFGGFPVSGGLARTAVNYQAGARSGIASMVTAVVVVLTLVAFTPLFTYLPVPVLAAMIIVAAVKMIDFRELVHLMKVDRLDGWTLLATFALTLFWGVEEGILSGVVLSLVLFVWRSAHPHIAELGYLERADGYMNIDRFPSAKTFPKILMLRVDGPLFFANTGFVEDWLRDRIADHPDVKYVVFDLSSVSGIDAVGIKVLRGLMLSYDAHGIDFAFAGMRGPVRDLFARAGWRDSDGKDIGYRTLPQVLRKIEGLEGINSQL